MNIFVLDADPVLAAQSLCDKHVVKMALESAQLLCTAAYALGVQAPYRPTHAHHPCSKWLLEGQANLWWLVRHTDAIFSEYALRYGREHASCAVMRQLTPDTLLRMKEALPPGETPFVQAMPEQYRGPDAVAAYRAYYLGEKARFATWRAPSAPPAWWLQSSEQRERPVMLGEEVHP